MTESMQQPLTFVCERCGRIIGGDILKCPDRSQGYCPYTKRDLVLPFSRFRSLILVVVGAVFIMVPLMFWQVQVQVSLMWVIAFLFFTFGCFAFILGSRKSLHTRTLLYNPISGLIYISEALFGVVLQRKLIPRAEPLALDLPLPHSLVSPPSATKLAEIAIYSKPTIAHTTDLFRAAFVGLMARGFIQTRQYKIFSARGRGELKRGQDVYILAATKETNATSIDGALEKRIISVMNSRVMRQEVEALEWPDGPPIYELIRAVYGNDVSSPERWVFNLVANDAVACGWGQLKGWPKKYFQPNAAPDKQLQSEQEILTQLSSTIAKQQPTFSKMLDNEIEKAIRSRIPTPDGTDYIP